MKILYGEHGYYLSNIDAFLVIRHFYQIFITIAFIT